MEKLENHDPAMLLLLLIVLIPIAVSYIWDIVEWWRNRGR